MEEKKIKVYVFDNYDLLVCADYEGIILKRTSIVVPTGEGGEMGSMQMLSPLEQSLTMENIDINNTYNVVYEMPLTPELEANYKQMIKIKEENKYDNDLIVPGNPEDLKHADKVLDMQKKFKGR